MINEKDILTRLQNGENAQDIANELANMLNTANATYLQEVEAKRKAEEEAKALVAKNAATEEEKNDLAQIIADAIMDYIDLCEPDLLDDETLEAKEVRDLLDALIPMMVSLKKIAALSPDGGVKLAPGALTMAPKPMATKSDDETIADFLRNIGL